MFQKAEFDLGNQIEQLYTIGNKSFSITDYAPTVVLTEYADNTKISPWEDLNDQTTKELRIELVGPNGMHFGLVAGKARHDSVNESDDAGRVVLERTLSLLPDSGEDHFYFVYSGSDAVPRAAEIAAMLN